jgi:chlorobactene glucosyltransferase
MIILFYIIFFFLILRFTVTLFNFISNPKLTASPKHYQELVSVLIPARNEAEDILPLLESLKNQDYQQIEVYVLDDNSDDGTYEVCERFAQTDARFHVLKGEVLKEGWLGKNFACHQLAKHAKGKYLLFLDADEQVKDGLINSAVHRMHMNKLDLLSLFTNQVMKTRGEQLVIPMMHYILLNLLPLRLVFLSKNPAFSAASGQFMMFNAATYQQYKWHKQVKKQVVEDVEIMKRVKQEKLNGEALLANGYIYCRMYKSYSEAINGFSKNMLSGFGNSIPGLLIYLFLVLLGPVLILMYLNSELFFFCCTLILLSRLMISLLSGQSPPTNILLHPFQMLSLGIISFQSIKKKITNTVTWKGRKVSI